MDYPDHLLFLILLHNCLPSNKICLIFGSSSLSPQYNRFHTDGLGWGTNTLMFFHDNVTFSLRSSTLGTLAMTSVPGSVYLALNARPFRLSVDLDISDFDETKFAIVLFWSLSERHPALCPLVNESSAVFLPTTTKNKYIVFWFTGLDLNYEPKVYLMVSNYAWMFKSGDITPCCIKCPLNYKRKIETHSLRLKQDIIDAFWVYKAQKHKHPWKCYSYSI